MQKKGSKFSMNGSPMQKLVDTRLANLTLGLHLNKNFHRLCHKFRKVPHQKKLSHFYRDAYPYNEPLFSFGTILTKVQRIEKSRVWTN